jgi:hypothetical protein
MRNAFKILVGKPEGNRSFRRNKRRSEDNVRMDLRKIRLEGMNWMHLAQDRDWWRAVVNTVLKLRVI